MKTILDNPWLRYLTVSILAFSFLMIAGCRGCGDDKGKDETVVEETEKDKKKKKKPDFETRTSVLLPGYFPDTKQPKPAKRNDPLGDAMAKLNNPLKAKNRAKLGHWYASSNLTVAHNFNFEGELTAHPIDASSRPIRIPATDYFLTTSRPVSLPKGEWKNLETSIYLPPRDIRVSSVTVQYSLNQTTGGLNLMPAMFDSTQLMKPFQYHIVLMSNRPDTYKFLELTDTFQLPSQSRDVPPFYVVVPTQPGKPFPLPGNALNMTTIAYLFWDDFDPDVLNEEQQTAILDWIHFGGQLVLSGPDCLDKLQTSFLADVLPAHFENSRNLTNQDLAKLNSNWALPGKSNRDAKRTLQISNKVPLLGVAFKPHDDSNFVDGTGEMAIERRIGRGRIVATAFSLNAPAIRKWRSFKSFLNGAILRRPARHFNVRVDDGYGYGDVSFEWETDGTIIFDPLIHSTLRFIARDLARPNEGVKRSASPDNVIVNDFVDDGLGSIDDNPEYRVANSLNTRHSRNFDDHWHYGGYQDTAQMGTAGWNDNSGISLAARETLQEAAGIAPPSSSFVFKMLAVYLIVLVPVNWLIFRLSGRVEFAWIAAPVISIVGAIVVVKMASLDIGFVRSNTQIGFLEIHSGYSRAHLAEYSALYSSLSTRYSADLNNPTTQSLPFAIKDHRQTFLSREKTSQVVFRKTNRSRLEGFQIQSNSTGMLHSESMLDLKGVVSLISTPAPDETHRIANSTPLALNEVGIIGRDKSGNYQFAWIGDLPADSNTHFQFEPTTINSLGQPWKKSLVFRNTRRASSKIWADNVNQGRKFNPINQQSIGLEQLQAFPEIQEKMSGYRQLFLQQRGIGSQWSAEDFNNAYQLLDGVSEVTVGRLFDAVIDSLTLAPGEIRMIGVTDQRLGQTEFDPKSTQVDQQTLVVIHLKRPRLPTAKRDVNAYEDFKIISDLDQQREEEKLNELLDNK